MWPVIQYEMFVNGFVLDCIHLHTHTHTQLKVLSLEESSRYKPLKPVSVWLLTHYMP